MDSNAEKELEKHIQNQVSWDALPLHAKSILENSQTKWKQYVIKFSIKHQLRWKTNLVRKFVSDERLYYQEIVRSSVSKLVLYPYHIIDKLVGLLNVTPFKYYLVMMTETMANSKSYDELPNFTAVDCLRMLGVGRNQYIDMMNKCRTKGFLFKKKKDVIKSLLPSRTMEKSIEYWWILNAGLHIAEEERGCSQEELDILSELRVSPKQAGIFDRESVLSLLARGLIFIDVPIANSDFISVPPLEGFVMNRVSGDYFENLLYKIFVSIDERTNIQNLAELIQVDEELVKQAASLYCRLGFAKKKNLEPLVNNDDQTDSVLIKTKWNQSWIDYNASISSNSNSGVITQQQQQQQSQQQSQQESNISEESTLDVKPILRIGLIFDSSIIAFLMMGNLGYGLKNHAVTMFEVGKLANEALDDFLGELAKIDIGEFVDGEARRYATSAVALRDTIRFLRYNEKIPATMAGLDLLSCERMNSLEEATRQRVLLKNYAMLISMSPFATDSCPVISVTPAHFGPAIYEAASIWFKLYVYSIVGTGPNSILLPKGSRLKKIPNVFRDCEKLRICSLDHESMNINLSQLLPTVNEALLSSPVLVQAFSYVKFDSSTTKQSRHASREQTIREQLSIIDVPFPLDPLPETTSNSSDSSANYVITGEYTSENMHLHPDVRRIDNIFDLSHSIGYISMLRKEVHVPTENCYRTTWIPYNIYFGIPIFDASLNQRVFEKIERYQLLSESNIAQHNHCSRVLSINLLRFISSTCPPVHPDLDVIDQNKINTTLPSVQNLPLPTQNISFVNGSLEF
ncbi:FAM91 family protein [Heterostelium album PN500]|uniref:FAM91 family protein n=1 Tax=Heterostelium pallidum (strain ATCC 26659 / Pp 5 / PN500) TaxID=670386 RepID=D3B625_HETP5|nr:FAM91 family protein [Heterostelium album PN500]EFA83323.1 FAM91 family protein [Heterostelium album PN500]|eukprot:XP_020435440.1 FAM91 family protein [Heterostelium album PN500]